MKPLLAMLNFAYEAVADAVSASNGNATHTARDVASDVGYARISKLGAGVILPEQVPTALNSVGDVFLRVAGKQVGWVDAWRVIAGVAQQHSIRNGANAKLVSDPVRAHRFLVDADRPVAGFEQRARPNPAVTALIDLLPKALRKVFSLPLRLHIGATRARAGAAFSSMRWRRIVRATTHRAHTGRAFFFHRVTHPQLGLWSMSHGVE